MKFIIYGLIDLNVKHFVLVELVHLFLLSRILHLVFSQSCVVGQADVLLLLLLTGVIVPLLQIATQLRLLVAFLPQVDRLICVDLLVKASTQSGVEAPAMPAEKALQKNRTVNGEPGC